MKISRSRFKTVSISQMSRGNVSGDCDPCRHRAFTPHWLQVWGSSCRAGLKFNKKVIDCSSGVCTTVIPVGTSAGSVIAVACRVTAGQAGSVRRTFIPEFIPERALHLG